VGAGVSPQTKLIRAIRARQEPIASRLAKLKGKPAGTDAGTERPASAHNMGFALKPAHLRTFQAYYKELITWYQRFNLPQKGDDDE